MHKIIIENECGCFRRSDLENNLQIPSKDDALLKALNIKDQMNKEFCGKHDFQAYESGDNFVIRMMAPQSTQSSGCCGTGCCGSH